MPPTLLLAVWYNTGARLACCLSRALWKFLFLFFLKNISVCRSFAAFRASKFNILTMSSGFRAEPVWRNGRMYDKGSTRWSRGLPGSKHARANWFFPWALLSGPVRWDCSLRRASPLFAHRARPSLLKCKNLYLVLAQGEGTAVQAVGSIV